MKTINSKFILLMMLLLSFSVKAEIIDGVIYDGSTITGYKANLIPDTLVIPDFATSAVRYALKGAPMKCLITNKNLKTQEGTFAQCQNLESVTINSREVSNKEFFNCVKLQTITLNGVRTIGDDAFRHCYVLDNVTLPPSVRYVGTHAFADCSALKIVVVKYKPLSEQLNSSLMMYFSNTPYVASSNVPRSPNQAQPNDSRYKIKGGMVVY